MIVGQAAARIVPAVADLQEMLQAAAELELKARRWHQPWVLHNRCS
jgi:hypothetical protein